MGGRPELVEGRRMAKGTAEEAAILRDARASFDKLRSALLRMRVELFHALYALPVTGIDAL
jgi:hypothetical protein